MVGLWTTLVSIILVGSSLVGLAQGVRVVMMQQPAPFRIPTSRDMVYRPPRKCPPGSGRCLEIFGPEEERRKPVSIAQYVGLGRDEGQAGPNGATLYTGGFPADPLVGMLDPRYDDIPPEPKVKAPPSAEAAKDNSMSESYKV